MNIAKLILNYQKRGIKLTVVDGRLHFSAPQNTLTNEDKSILKEHKEKIIYYLLQNNESEIIVNEEDKYEEFPLTDIQASYLIGQDNVYKFGGTNQFPQDIYKNSSPDGLLFHFSVGVGSLGYRTSSKLSNGPFRGDGSFLVYSIRSRMSLNKSFFD